MIWDKNISPDEGKLLLNKQKRPMGTRFEQSWGRIVLISLAYAEFIIFE